MKLFAFCFFISTLSLSARSEEVCFSSIEEYHKIKASLPEIFHKIPAYFTNSVPLLGGGAFKITPVAELGKFKIDGGYYKFKEKKRFDSSYLKKFCLKNDVITVLLENGQSYKITQIESNSFVLHFIKDKEKDKETLEQATLYLSSQRDYDRIIEKSTPDKKAPQEEGVQ